MNYLSILLTLSFSLLFGYIFCKFKLVQDEEFKDFTYKKDLGNPARNRFLVFATLTTVSLTVTDYPVHLLLISILILISIYDILFLMIPDMLNFLILSLGVYVIFTLTDSREIYIRLFSIIGITAMFFLINYFNENSFGGGDMKLFICLSSIFGLKYFIFIFCITLFIYIILVVPVLRIMGRKIGEIKISFGPIISVPCLLIILFPDQTYIFCDIFLGGYLIDRLI